MSEDGRYQAREVIPGPIGPGQGGTPTHYGPLTTPHIPGWPQTTHLTFEQRSLATLEQILQAAKETNEILRRNEETAAPRVKKK